MGDQKKLILKSVRTALSAVRKHNSETEKTFLFPKEHTASVKNKNGMDRYNSVKPAEKGKGNPLGPPRDMVISCMIEAALVF